MHLSNCSIDVFGQLLAVTSTKDMNMVKLWDDGAITVEVDTGRVLTEGI